MFIMKKEQKLQIHITCFQRLHSTGCNVRFSHLVFKTFKPEGLFVLEEIRLNFISLIAIIHNVA